MSALGQAAAAPLARSDGLALIFTSAENQSSAEYFTGLAIERVTINIGNISTLDVSLRWPSRPRHCPRRLGYTPGADLRYVHFDIAHAGLVQLQAQRPAAVVDGV